MATAVEKATILLLLVVSIRFLQQHELIHPAVSLHHGIAETCVLVLGKYHFLFCDRRKRQHVNVVGSVANTQA
jgi:hypothetical protein